MLYKSKEKFLYNCTILSVTFPSISSAQPMRQKTYMNKNVYTSPVKTEAHNNYTSYTLYAISQPEYIISNRCSKSLVSPGSKIYVEKECIMPRDIIRNSGYSIVLDRTKADVVLIPSWKDCPTCSFDAIAYNSCDEIVLFTKACKQDITDDNKDELRKLMQGYGYHDITFACDLLSNEAYFIPRYGCYEDVLCSDDRSVTYLEENKLPVKYPNVISKDTLTLWKNISDNDLIAKLLIGSDAKDYPITMLYLLHNKWYMLSVSDYPKLKMLFDEIKYDPNTYLNSNILSYYKPVTPKDWNMLQSIIMDEIGLSNDGGFISMKTANQYDDLVRTRACVKPLYIENEMTSATLMNIIEQSNKF